MILNHDGVDILLDDPDCIVWSEMPAMTFLEGLYRYLYTQLDERGSIFQLNYDDLDREQIEAFIDSCDTRQQLKRLNGKKISTSDWGRDKVGKAFLLFFAVFPNFALMIKNIHTDVEGNIKNSEAIIGETLSTANFLRIKRAIDQVNRARWSREQNNNEKQAGVSILGSISEKLIEIALETLIDGTKFFRSQHQDVQSYGDFVLMCLPNNLWISVKSNFARERLLASGFTSDIIGVGFFTQFSEFISRSKIRNFIKVGFLAMYLPDIPITDEQVQSGNSTYHEVINYYDENNIELPQNINGNPFLRPATQLYDDLNELLLINDTNRRTIINY